MYKRLGMSADTFVIDDSLVYGVSVIFIDKDANNSIMCRAGSESEAEQGGHRPCGRGFKGFGYRRLRAGDFR